MRMRITHLLTVLILCARLTAQTGLLNAEYFWDPDPGVGNGIAVVAVDGTFDQALEYVLAQTSALPSAGEHTFSIRARDEDGNWGPVFSTVLTVLPDAAELPDISVNEGEYYWDTDPGEGNGEPLLALDGNFDAALEAIGADIAQLPSPGLHVLNMRILDVNNNWSAPFQVVVQVLTNSLTFPTIHVGAAEYWFNTDPGFGGGRPMLVADGAFDDAYEAIMGGTIPVPVIEGINVLWMRAKDDDGGWGPSFGVVVNVDTTITGTVAVIELESASEMIVAPNPTSADAGFRIEQHGPRAIRVVILDSQGRLISDHNYGERSRIDVAMDGLATGLYPVGIYRGDAVTWHSVVLR